MTLTCSAASWDTCHLFTCDMGDSKSHLLTFVPIYRITSLKRFTLLMGSLGTDTWILSSDISRRLPVLLGFSALPRPAPTRTTQRWRWPPSAEAERSRLTLPSPLAGPREPQRSGRRCWREEVPNDRNFLLVPAVVLWLCGHMACNRGPCSKNLSLSFPNSKAKQPHELQNTQSKQILFSFLTAASN